MSRAWKFRDPEGLYFITYAIVGWVDVLTRRHYKDIVVDSLRHCQKHKGLELFAWVVMTNHVHLIARSNSSTPMSDIMRDHKKFTSKELLREIAGHPQESRREWMLRIFRDHAGRSVRKTEFQLWQHDTHPIMLESPEEIDARVEYIHMNPVVQGWVEEPEHYIYSSARDHAGMKGMLELAEL